MHELKNIIYSSQLINIHDIKYHRYLYYYYRSHTYNIEPTTTSSKYK